MKKDKFSIETMTVSEHNKLNAKTLKVYMCVHAKHMQRTNENMTISQVVDKVMSQLDYFYETNPEYTAIDIRKEMNTELTNYLLRPQTYLNELHDLFKESYSVEKLDTDKAVESWVVCNHSLKELTSVLDEKVFDTSILNKSM